MHPMIIKRIVQILWKIFLNIIRWIIFFYAVMALIMAVGLAFPLIGVISFTTIVTLIPLRRRLFAWVSDNAYKKLSYALPAAVILIMLISLFTPILPNPGAEWNTRLSVIKKRVVNVPNSHLKFREKVGLYTLGLVMSVSAYPIYPEVAKEQFYYQLPGSGERVWYSDFAMASNLISKPVYNFMQSLPKTAPEGSIIKMSEQKIKFRYGRTDHRVALALQPCILSGQAVRKTERWIGSFQAQIPIRYFPECRAPLFTLVDTQVWFEEGLFYAMQQKGWFFPYLATWRWEVSEDELPDG